MDSSILKIVPNPEELQIVSLRNQGCCQCPELGCSYVASNACLLGLHKSQVHNFRTKHRKSVENVHYHCPVAGCNFSSQSERYLKSFETLRTHYMKVHSEKAFFCAKCNKNFGLERDCHRHEAECGESFSCQNCGKVYTNKSALRRHCDYNRHYSPALEAKPKAVKQNKDKGMKVSNRVKEKQSAAIKSALPFILPKQILPESSSTSQQNSLHIQTDVSGSLFFISKMPSGSSTSQAVQTMGHFSETRSAGIQTMFEPVQPRINEASGQTKRLSTGIQTMLPHFNISGSFCVAQTQTNKSILLRAMVEAKIPVLNVNKRGQRSSGSQKRRNKSCTEISKAFHSAAVEKDEGSAYPHDNCTALSQASVVTDEDSHMDLSKSIDEMMSSMSTQTNLSCISELMLPRFYETHSGIQLQDCHTQTQDNTRHNGQVAHPYLDQSRRFVVNSDRVTQTKSNLSTDQITQTGNVDNSHLNNVPYGFMPIHDNQTQTVCEPLSSCIIHNIQTQTSIAGITNIGQVQDQSTTCEGLLGLNERELSSFSNEQWNMDNSSSLDLHLQNKYSEEDLLFQVIEDGVSYSGGTLSDIEGTKTEGETANIGIHLCESTSLPVSMETQTLGNLGTDSMTQTMDDLGWHMGTQTVDYSLADMMTQTGDDILEFLTNDIHTQTFDDFSMRFEVDDLLETTGCTGTSADNSITEEMYLLGQCGDHSRKTIWNTDDPTCSSSSSFASLLNEESSKDHEPQVVLQSGFFVDKENKDSEDRLSYTKNLISDASTKWGNVLTPEARMDLSDLGRDTETAETQTMYDPFFYDLSTFSYPHTNTVKHLESSHTQTTSDPMLPALVTDDDSMQLFQPEALAQKETSETQTGSHYIFPGARDCQKPWDNFLISVGTSETQTNDDDFLGASSSHTYTQTILEPELSTSLDFISSFTQTSLDQNTQTGNIFDL